ncbi:hypothetical protein TNCV_5048141 [Trichonephila clavipes]|nr:hypothetical protein TNCV_5048141 [Trichonephila clavipes]
MVQNVLKPIGRRCQLSHRHANEGEGDFSERTLDADAEADDPGLRKSEQREQWPSRDPPHVVYKRDA